MRAFLWQWASRIVLGCALIGLCRTARAADAPDEVECRWANGPIEIDGKADEDAWKHAAVVEQFTLPWLQEKARPAKTATRARLLWDREYFYFFADMDDTDLYADVREHDGQTWDNDVFEIFLKPADDKPGYYEFQVNAAGTTLDAFFPRRGAGGFGRFKNDADFHLEAKVKLRGTLNKWTDKDEGWSVEGRIPWRDFMKTGGRPKVGETWKYELCRYDYSVDFEGPELSNTNRKSSLNHPNFHQWEDYSPLKFVGPDPKHSARPVGIEKLAPMTTSRVVGSPDPPLPFRAKHVFPKLELAYPIAVATEPGSQRLLLITQPFSYGPTTLSRIDDTQQASDPEKLLTIDGVTYGMTFHPDFAKNGYIYIGSNGPLKGDKKTQVTRYIIAREKPWKLDPESARVIIEWASDGHNGGDLGFGRDGMLYITSGDGTSDSDTNIVGQDLTRFTAKVLRIDVDHPAEGREYSVPADNPFVGQADVRPETWAYGFRNPWRLTVDPHNGQIWVGNNGQDLWEQVYLIERGANYGWSVLEGSHPFYPNRKAGPTPFSKPAAEHPHSIARSLTGGVVYYGSRFPELKGAYLYGDYSTGKIWGLRHDGKQATWHQELADTTLAISGFGLDSQGELLIADHRAPPKGALYTFERTPESSSHEKFPRKLSETGLFASVAGHKPAAGTIPYSVNAPLWSDGAIKERFLAIPSKDSQEPPIEMTANRGWNFPDETVLVKSFALDLVEGNSASRRWIETRLLTKQEGEWVGYSYMWNADQTDADLVAAEGLDRPYAVSDGKQARTQEWHFPSRTECMVCHSRAANYVLGLTTLQMNRDHDYGGTRDNQLHVLEHLGLLRMDWRGETITAIREEAKARGMPESEINDSIDRQTSTRDQRGTPSTTLLPQNPEHIRHLVDPYDRSAPLEARARSYLHANCAQCHVEAGGGNAKLELEFTTRLDKAYLIDAVPLHHTYDLPDPRIIAPGHPERSVLLYRLSHRGRGQMPQLATSLVDQEAVELFREWIAGMKTAEEPAK